MHPFFLSQWNLCLKKWQALKEHDHTWSYIIIYSWTHQKIEHIIFLPIKRHMKKCYTHQPFWLILDIILLQGWGKEKWHAVRNQNPSFDSPRVRFYLRSLNPFFLEYQRLSFCTNKKSLHNGVSMIKALP